MGGRPPRSAGYGWLLQPDRGRAAAADEEWAAGERRGAGGVRVAHEGGDHVRVLSCHQLQWLGLPSRIGAIRPRPMSAGGWCRETNEGLSSEASCSSSQASWSRESSPWSIRLPSRAGTASPASGSGSPRPRAAGRAGRGRSPCRAGRGRTPRGRRGCRCRPASGRARRRGRSRASAYSSGRPWSAMSPETRSTSGRGSSASRCATTASARAPASGGPPKCVSLTCAMRLVIRAPGTRTHASADRRA